MEILQNIKTELEKTIIEAGSFIREEKGKVTSKNIDIKSHNSFVTYVDKETEKMLVDKLEQLIPGSGFIAEEGTAKETNSDYRWIIDPLDGTTNFIHDLYPVSVSVALQYKKKTIAGLVYEIGNNELFTAYEGYGAFLNQNKIHVSQTENVSGSLISTGFPYYDFDRIDKYLDVLKYFMINSRGVRRHGSAATDLAYVACGRFDCFFEYSLSPWDVAAGAFIVKQAGGIVTDFKGKDDFIFGKEIISTNHKLSQSILSEIKRRMYK